MLCWTCDLTRRSEVFLQAGVERTRCRCRLPSGITALRMQVLLGKRDLRGPFELSMNNRGQQRADSGTLGGALVYTGIYIRTSGGFQDCFLGHSGIGERGEGRGGDWETNETMPVACCETTSNAERGR
jgi:hypothetical protein